MTELLAPNGKPSNLTPEQYLLVRTPEFKAWFGDWENLVLTKLNDSGIDEISLKRLEDGVSKVVDENGEPLVVYRTDVKNINTYKKRKEGTFFQSNKKVAEGYYSILNSFFIKIINPKINYDAIPNQENADDIKGTDFDGVFNKGAYGGNEIIVINSNQIKLADGTNTTFDGNNTDIRFDGGGEINIQPIQNELAFNYLKRNDYYGQFIAKNGKLFYIVLHKSQAPLVQVFDGEKLNNALSKGYGINAIARAVFNVDFENKTFSGFSENQSISVDEEYRRIGIATAITDFAEEKLGMKYVPSKLLSEEMKGFIKNRFNFKKGGRTIAQTPAPKKDRIYGSDINKEGSSKDLKSAKKIELSDKTIESIKNKVDKHNEKHPNKKITIESAKAVVRRGMGAYSSSHRPTISGGNPNSRVAWGLARLNAFLYKIVNGKSKSGKYSQDNDLIEELGYKVQKYSDGGDIQAYQEAMDISEFKDGGEAKPKKVYVSIKLPYDIERNNSNYFNRYNQRPFQELKNGKLEGLVGVSSSPNNIAEWFVNRDCLVVMNYEEFIAINETETINYYDPYQLMANKLYLFKRLYANVSRYGEQDNVYQQTLTKIGQKIKSEIVLEMNISDGQKYSELYRIDRFLDPYITSSFYRWVDEKQNVESPIDLTNAILEFNKVDDSYLGNGFENPVLTFDELLPLVEKGVTNASKIYESEQEIVLTNRELNIPKNSQLFFIGKDELGRNRESNLDELIEEYDLQKLYDLYFVDRQDLEKYRSIWLKKEEEKFKTQIEEGRQDLELKKEQILEELLYFFLDKSLNSIKNEIEKDILDYSESLEFYDKNNDEYIEQNWYSIPIVQSILNTYTFIVKNFWKSYIENKQVKNLDLYAFVNYFNNVESEIKRYFENNKQELEELYNYRNTKGSGSSLDPYLFERLLLKSVNDWENLPEWIDYKELAKMYLDKMGRELYRYYNQNDLKLKSNYELGGETELNKNKKMENEILIIDMNMYFGDTNVNFKNKEIPLKINSPINQNDFIEWAEENNIEFEQWGDFWDAESDIIDTSYGYTFEIPLNKYIDYLKTEKYYTGGELKKGIKTEMEHKDTIEKIKTGDYSTKESAEMIAKDHLQENDKYYTHLLQMERQFKKGGQTDAQQQKISKVMHEFKEGNLKTSYGEKVTDKDQAIAIALSEAGVPKKENGGKIESIKSQKGDIKISLDEHFYDLDSDVELVPVSELIKFREFDRRKTPKYNQDNSRDNINHLKFMFQKEGVKSPLIIEYSPEDNAVLLIEGNHRLNSAIDLGMEYLPARVVLKKYSGFNPVKLKNTMKVSGVQADQFGYIPSNLKPSKVGISGTLPLKYEEGGIIEGQLHSECNEPHGCGEKFQVGEGGHIIEAERDEAVIVSEAFNDNNEYTIEGTPSEIASALNVLGDGKNFDKGAIIKDEYGNQIELPQMKEEAKNTDVEPIIESGSIIINRRSMADEKEYEVTGTPKQIASAINSLNGNGVVIEQGAKIEKS